MSWYPCRTTPKSLRRNLLEFSLNTSVLLQFPLLSFLPSPCTLYPNHAKLSLLPKHGFYISVPLHRDLAFCLQGLTQLLPPAKTEFTLEKPTQSHFLKTFLYFSKHKSFTELPLHVAKTFKIYSSPVLLISQPVPWRWNSVLFIL